MSIHSDTLLSFPEDFPSAKACVFFAEDRLLVTGHDNGYVVKWDLRSGDYEILHDCSSAVEAISKSHDNEVAVGCNSGLLFTFTLGDPKKKNLIREADYSVFSRIWRLIWASRDSLLVASTYGVFNLFTKSALGWILSQLDGHSDSIFGLDGSNDKLVVSGDWSGKIIIRRYIDGQYDTQGLVNIQAVVQGISCHRDMSFATIDEYGHINFFEQAADTSEWKSVFEINTASDRGTYILLTDDGKSIFAGTYKELIQFDIDTQQVRMIPVSNIRAIFSNGDNIIVLTDRRLVSIPRSNISVPESAMKYRYSKVSLIGHTGAGKTTLCSLVTSGSTIDIKSTFGKRIWNWILPKEESTPERRIMFHDHGGQETVLDTFLPFLADSDVILIFFKKTDRSTFKKALKIREELDSILTGKTKIFLVETFIDHDMDEIDRDELENLINNGTITACLRVSPTTWQGLDTFKHTLEDEIDWKSTRTMIISENVETLERSINALIENKTAVLQFQQFKLFLENNSRLSITTNHLKFLLSNFSSQGLIEYYPEVVDAIIFSDETYNELRSKIPMEVENKNGIISIKEIEIKFGNYDYIRMLDQLFIRYGVSIENDNLRIFPSKLKETISIIDASYKGLLDSPQYQEEVNFPLQNIKGSRLLKALSELKLRCIDASIREGIFAWERNACVYYKYEESGNAIKGRYLRFSYTIGGEKQSKCDRLYKDFQTIIERLYGPSLTDSPVTKKKIRKKLTLTSVFPLQENSDSMSKKLPIILKKRESRYSTIDFMNHICGEKIFQNIYIRLFIPILIGA
jgi:GTPase SAR1 family protein